MSEGKNYEQVRNCFVNTSVLITFLLLGIGLLSMSFQHAIGLGFFGLPLGVVLTVSLHWDKIANESSPGSVPEGEKT